MGTKQGHWDVKEALLETSDEYRPGSVYGGGRESVYESPSMEYPPQAPHYFPSSTRSSGYGNLIEARHSYGDIRKQVGSYEEFDSHPQQPGLRNREREYAY